MKTTFYLLLIAITLLACRTTKSATENTIVTETKTTQQSDSSKTNVRFVEKNLEQIEKQSGEWSAKLTTYDTTLPVEKATGKPPVKSELLIINKTQKVIKTVDKAKTNSLAVLKSAAKSESKVQEKIHYTQQLSYWWVWVLVGIVISILLFLAWKYIPSD